MDNFFLNRGPSSLGAITRPHSQSTSSSSPEGNSSSYFVQELSTRNSKLCDSCKEASYMSRCQDCEENLCDPCVRAHQRVRITSDHRIIFFSEDVVNIPDSVSLFSSLQNNQLDITSRALSRFFSLEENQTENSTPTLSPASSDSSQQQMLLADEARALSSSQQSLFSEETVRAVKEQSDQVLIRLNLAKEKICRDMELLQYQQQIMEQNCLKQASQIRYNFEQSISVAQRREAELIKRVDEFKATELATTSQKVERYQQCLINVIAVTDYLTDASKLNTAAEIVEKNKRAVKELEVVTKVVTNMTPREPVAIITMPIEPSIQSLLNNMGGVALTSYLNPLLNQELGRCSARGRPILGLKSPVIAAQSDYPTYVIGKEVLCRPWGVCCDPSGNIVVADRSHNRIVTFKQDGTVVRSFGKLGCGPGEFNRPAGLTIDMMNRLLVVDKDNHRIQIFTLTGNFLLQFGEKGANHGEFNYPWDIAVNTSGTMVISDTRNHRIQLFDCEGRFINKYGFDAPTLLRYFDSPRGVCFSPDGDVIVTDFNNHRILIIDKSLTQTRCLGSEGSGNNKEFLRPQGVICDDKGQILIADSRNNRIQIYSYSGLLLGMIGEAGKGIGQMDRPSGIALTPEGRVVVVDFGNDRVQMF